MYPTGVGATGAGAAGAAGGSGADDLSNAFDKAIKAQKELQEVGITKQPRLDAAKEKPR